MEFVDTHICGACKQEFTDLDEFQGHKRQCLTAVSLACEQEAHFKASIADHSLQIGGVPTHGSITPQLVSDPSGVLVGPFVEFSGVELSNGDGRHIHEVSLAEPPQVLAISRGEVMPQQQQQLVLNNVVLGLPNGATTMVTTAPSSTDNMNNPVRLWQNGQTMEPMTVISSASSGANSSLPMMQPGVGGTGGDVNTIHIAVGPGNNLTIIPGTSTSQPVGIIAGGTNTIPIFQNLQSYASYKNAGWLSQLLLIYCSFIAQLCLRCY